jgi:hypothetical protein
MGRIDVYECQICKKKLDYKPVRLVKQLYGINPRYPSQYAQYTYYNFCYECYEKFDNWVNRRKKNENK